MSRTKWELASSTDKEYIFELARSMGWLDQKVQVRRTRTFSETRYAIESYEGECGCHQLIKPF